VGRKKTTDEVGASAPALSSDVTVLASKLKDKLADSTSEVLVLDTESTIVTKPKFLSTQHPGLDSVLGGGIPCGRIVELFSGSEGAGKSTLAAHLVAECQRTGGIAVMFDSEKGNLGPRLEQLGVDLSQMIYVDPESVENVFSAVEGTIEWANSGTPYDKVLIVWDSVAATQTRHQANNTYDDSPQIGELARVLSYHLKKLSRDISRSEVYFVAVNQTREKIGVMYGDKMTTPGGRGIHYWASTRIRMNAKQKIKSSAGDVDGWVVEVYAVKNKVIKPFRYTNIHLLFDGGIDGWRGLFDFLADKGALTKGAWNSFTGETAKFRYADFKEELTKLSDDKRASLCTLLADNFVGEEAIQVFFPEYKAT
jgi:recombination protein RecA